jgi:membrane protease YdiL (CAAX protease family)
MPRTLPQPGFWLACGLAALAVGLQMMFAMPLEAVDIVLRAQGRDPLKLAHDPLALGFINIFALGLAIGLGLLLNRVSPRAAFPFGGLKPLAWLALLPAGLGGAILLSEVDNLTRTVLPPPPWLLEFFESFFLKSDRPLSLFFTLVIVAPVTEELLFRGIILRGLLGRFGVGVALLVSSGLFALLHMNPWQLLPAFALGWLFGWYYLRSGSLWPCVAGHALNNFAFFLITQGAFGLMEPVRVEDLQMVEFQPWWLNLLGAALLVAGILLFRRSTQNTAADTAAPVAPPPVQPPVLLP